MVHADISGMLIIDKPLGITSHDVVQRVRRALKTKKVGHAGTLDPQASGVLVLGIGKGTRLLEFLVADDKAYLAKIALGSTSTTEDSEGELTVQSAGPWPELMTVEHILEQFRGAQQQRPPMYSALKQGGEALYAKARRGEIVDIPLRDITLTALEMIDYTPPLLAVRVECSKGTYIRSLARDIGEALGTGAYLAGLRRTRSGTHTLAEAVSLEVLEQSEDPVALLQPVAKATESLPRVMVNRAQAGELTQGKVVVLDSEAIPSSSVVAVFLDNSQELFIGIAAVDDGHSLVPKKILCSADQL